MKIILFGGSGLLGQELMKIDPDMLCPAHTYLDINDFEELEFYITKEKPDIIIHAAAETSSHNIADRPYVGINANIVGTANIALCCHFDNIRIVYISTDYVYPGKHGRYEESEDVNPVNLYAWTKLGGECSVKCVENHLIIRTSFGASKFPYPEAYTDLFTSKDYVDVIAPMIYKAAISNVTGVMNVGTERKSMYDYAKERNPDVGSTKNGYKDFSLNTNKYDSI